MSAIGGERDVLLQATAERFSTVAEGKYIDMSAAPPFFHMDANGAGTPATIDVVAKPVNLVGSITFTVSAGAQVRVNGNVASVDFSTMTADVAVVTAKIVEFGVEHIRDFIISKIRDGAKGDSGLAGNNIGQAVAYKRSATAPTDTPGPVIYTFATASITTPAGNSLANGWSKNIPAGDDPLWVRVAGAVSRNPTDDIANNEWAGAAELARSGTNGTDGLNVAQVSIHRRSTTNVAPALPTEACTLTFATGVLVGLNNGWSQDVPDEGGPYLFTSGAMAASRSATDEIPATEWRAASRLAADGTDGQRGTITITAPGYSAWSDASAVFEIGNAGYGDPINRDMVTLYDATHAVTKFYVNGDWLDAGSYINGNLLVDGTIAARALAADKLSAWTADLGEVTAGDLYGTTLHGGTGYPTSSNAWPTNGGAGFHLSEMGLRFGNKALGRYIDLTSEGNVDTTGLSINNGRANFAGNINTGTGASFRIEMGPDDPVYAMWAGAGTKNDTNAIFYLKRSGSGYFGGSLSAGILRTSVTNPTLDANSQVTDGPFGTNGGPITVVCSYSYGEEAGRDGGTYSASGPENEATIRLYRTIRDSPEELVQTFSVTGATYIQNTGVFDEMSFYQRVIEGSITYTDTVGGSQDRTFRAVLVTRSLRTITFNPMGGGIGNSMSNIRQSLSLITTE